MSKWFDRLFSGRQAGASVAATILPADPDALAEAVAQRRRGNQFLDSGDLHSAIDCYRKAVTSDPNSADAHTSLGFALKELGQLEAAQSALHKAASLKPDSFDPLYLLGQICNDLRQFEKAAGYFEKALALQPAFESLYGELCRALFQIKAVDKARDVITTGIQRYPENASFHLFLGNLFSYLEQWPQAIASYTTALKLSPNLTQVHTNLAAVFRAQGKLEPARKHAQCALIADPASPDAQACVAANLAQSGQLEEAFASYEKALVLDPDHAASHMGRGRILLKSGKLDAAAASFNKALAIEPDSAEIYRDLGLIYLELGQHREAEENSRKALALRPRYASALNNLGMALTSTGGLSEAEQCYLEALAIDPDSDVYHSNLGGLLMAQGRLPEAIASFRRATEIKPQLMTADSHLRYSNLLFCLSHSDGEDAKTLFADHCCYAQKFEAPLLSAWPQHTNPREPDRKLQVGFVSGDFYSHVVAQFVGPVLMHLSEYSELSLHAYHNNKVEDKETQLLKGYFKYWHPVAGLSDAAVAKQIGEDGIDILIDLSGHTGLNRLLTFAHKPAPLQVSWLGYPGTTGLRAVDYYLADELVLPRGQFDDQFTEKIVHLPALAPFRPSDLAPPVNALPAMVNGFVTFGSFNRVSKINRTVVAWWAELLRAVPSARLLIEGVREDGQCVQWLAQEGIARERLSLHGRNGLRAYHALHQQVDICLDTFPYNGATTSWCAVWMGVPTLAVAGGTPADRYGAAIMGQMGLTAFVAHDRQDFIRKGVYWANHLAELADLRTGMRQRFGQSAAGQPDLIAAALANALRTMWQRWCNGLPAESFVALTAADSQAGAV